MTKLDKLIEGLCMARSDLEWGEDKSAVSEAVEMLQTQARRIAELEGDLVTVTGRRTYFETKCGMQAKSLSMARTELICLRELKWKS